MDKKSTIFDSGVGWHPIENKGPKWGWSSFPADGKRRHAEVKKVASYRVGIRFLRGGIRFVELEVRSVS